MQECAAAASEAADPFCTAAREPWFFQGSRLAVAVGGSDHWPSGSCSQIANLRSLPPAPKGKHQEFGTGASPTSAFASATSRTLTQRVAASAVRSISCCRHAINGRITDTSPDWHLRRNQPCGCSRHRRRWKRSALSWSASQYSTTSGRRFASKGCGRANCRWQPTFVTSWILTASLLHRKR
jgi:hypothetical protein